MPRVLFPSLFFRLVPSDSIFISDAWNTPPVEPLPVPSPSITGRSFAAIQQQQQEQISNSSKPKKSLLEIQQEEEDLQAEIDFISWWAMEEERLRLQALAEANNAQSSAPSPKGRSNGGRGGKRASNARGKPAVGGDRSPKPPNRVSRRASPQLKAGGGSSS